MVGPSSQYFLWIGESKPKSAVGDWQRPLLKLFRLASIAHGHPHRFRHTFAARLLQAGAGLENVSKLLGHQSTRITERYYPSWIRERQEQWEADFRRTWPGSPLLPHGTPLAYEVERSQINQMNAIFYKMVEAGGVEPPSEKRYGPKTTCLAQFRLFRQPRSE